MQRAADSGITVDEAIEAIKLGVLAAGSLSYPVARNAIELIDEVLGDRPLHGEGR